MDNHTTLKLTEFRVLSNGANGGHSYVSSCIDYKNQNRKIVIFFKDKADEKKLQFLEEIYVEGNLLDEGEEYSLSLLGAKLIYS
ncbi:hypothetical protein L1278_001435 [Pontibacter sp. HSC-36F09]|nr:hypothetical protein [Pontibacter sp. HSC-36F09]